MRWHLDIECSKFAFEIEHSDKLFLMGSCFAENLAVWLKERYFNVFSNPNGVLFNPVSIYTSLKNILDNSKIFDERYLFYDGEYWRSYLHQTHFFNSNKEKFLAETIEQQRLAYEYIKSCDYLLITFGSAYVYEHVELKEVVANCHKLPSHHFNKRLLEVEEVVNMYQELIEKLRGINSKLRIIFSISPVKYLSYGVFNNHLSKAVLFLLVNKLLNDVGGVYYFPAYELVNDDLRDYRFYKEDMAHPNDLAVKYVMEKFLSVVMSERARETIEALEKLVRAMQHKIADKASVHSKKFVQQMLNYCKEMEDQYAYLNLEREKKYFVKLMGEKAEE